MTKTKIEWADATWNPVTGCYHGCEYCYARRIAERFGGYTWFEDPSGIFTDELDRGEKTKIHEAGGMLFPDFQIRSKNGKDCRALFPFKFEPTLYHDRLKEPAKVKKPQTIFVCSMADLFGEWVPDEWIKTVFDACEDVPRHRYLFLTKNPARYNQLISSGILPLKKNFWYGFSAENDARLAGRLSFMPWRHGANVRLHENEPDFAYNSFVSLEPLTGGINMDCADILATYPRWCIMGAMTGPGSKEGRKYLHKSDVLDIAKWADKYSIPVFMKDSLIPIVGEENMRREFPWKA